MLVRLRFAVSMFLVCLCLYMCMSLHVYACCVFRFPGVYVFRRVCVYALVFLRAHVFRC